MVRTFSIFVGAPSRLWRSDFLPVVFVFFFGVIDFVLYRYVVGKWMSEVVFVHSFFSIAGFLMFFLCCSWFLSRSGVLFGVLSVVFWVVLWLFLVLCAWVWLSVVQAGMLLSHDTVLMLLDNMGRVVLHAMQTSPWVLVGLVVLCVALAALVRKCFFRSSEYFREVEIVRFSQLLLSSLVLVASNVYALTGIQTPESPLFTALGFVAPQEKFMSYKFDSSVCGSVPRETSEISLGDLNDQNFSGERNVIFILAESLRHDISDMGEGRFDFFDSISREGRLYGRSYATSSHSDYSDLAFWYSQYPLRANYRRGYPSDADWRGVSVFEYLKKYGYKTAYYSSQNEKWGDMIFWLKDKGVDDFFHSEDYRGATWENVDDVHGLASLIKSGVATAGKVEDGKTLDLAISWIKANMGSKFAIGLNLQNTHYNYVIPSGGREPFQPSDIGFKQVYYSWPESEAVNVRNRYLNAVFNLDRLLYKFKSELVRLGLWDDAIVVLVGDNGEAFYEHGFGNHSGPMFEEVSRTFSVVKFPKGDSRNGTGWDGVVSHIDFVPIALEALGLPVSPAFQGVVDREKNPVFMHVNAMVKEFGLVDFPWKLLRRDFPFRSDELFNLEEDPLERKNMRSEEPVVFAGLEMKLDAWIGCQISFYQSPELYKYFYLK